MGPTILGGLRASVGLKSATRILHHSTARYLNDAGQHCSRRGRGNVGMVFAWKLRHLSEGKEIHPTMFETVRTISASKAKCRRHGGVFGAWSVPQLSSVPLGAHASASRIPCTRYWISDIDCRSSEFYRKSGYHISPI